MILLWIYMYVYIYIYIGLSLRICRWFYEIFNNATTWLIVTWFYDNTYMQIKYDDPYDDFCDDEMSWEYSNGYVVLCAPMDGLY